MSRDWMKSLCGDETRETTSTPFGVKGTAESWDCATNGQALVLARGATFAQRDSAPKVFAVVPEKAASPLRVRFDDLAKWCDFGPENLSTECSECKGSGVVECDYEHEHECPDCGGDREIVPCQPPRPGEICGVHVNRRLLWAYLAPIPDPGEYVEITGSDDWIGPVRIDGDGWIVVCMGMRTDGDIESFPPKEKVA